MIRVVKRYGSRKLYDTEESRYVSLEEIGDWVRAGQDVKVIDNSNDEDVTAQILMQVILEEGKRGASPFSSDILHDLIRHGERVVNSGVEQLQEGVGRLLDVSLDRIGPLRRVRQEADQLRDRLARLEQAIAEIEAQPAAPVTEPTPAARTPRMHVPESKARPMPVRKPTTTRV
jgi:polyhydroxyalkanoate synthesis repressor PhaR